MKVEVPFSQKIKKGDLLYSNGNYYMIMDKEYSSRHFYVLVNLERNSITDKGCSIEALVKQNGLSFIAKADKLTLRVED